MIQLMNIIALQVGEEAMESAACDVCLARRRRCSFLYWSKFRELNSSIQAVRTCGHPDLNSRKFGSHFLVRD